MKRACYGRLLSFKYKIESGQQCCGFASRCCGSCFFTLMRMRNLPFTLMRIRILLFNLMRIPHFFPDLDPPMLQNDFSTLMRIRIQTQLSNMMWFWISYPASQNDANPCGFGSITLPDGTRILLDPDGQQWQYTRGTNTVLFVHFSMPSN